MRKGERKKKKFDRIGVSQAFCCCCCCCWALCGPETSVSHWNPRIDMDLVCLFVCLFLSPLYSFEMSVCLKHNFLSFFLFAEICSHFVWYTHIFVILPILCLNIPKRAKLAGN